MIRVEQGDVPVTASFVEHIDKCLDCRACETACPSGVEYGKLVEFARARIERDYQRPFLSRLARGFAYRRLLPHPRRIAVFARLLRVYQRSGLQTLAKHSFRKLTISFSFDGWAKLFTPLASVARASRFLEDASLR